jgi:hypothetical protein
MTINQHAHIYSLHTSNFIFGQTIFLKILSMQPLLNARMRIKIFSVAWAQTVMKVGRVAGSTHLNSPFLLSHPQVVAALPLVLTRIILLLPPGRQRYTPSSIRVSGARGKDKCCCQHCSDV